MSPSQQLLAYLLIQDNECLSAYECAAWRPTSARRMRRTPSSSEPTPEVAATEADVAEFPAYASLVVRFRRASSPPRIFDGSSPFSPSLGGLGFYASEGGGGRWFMRSRKEETKFLSLKEVGRRAVHAITLARGKTIRRCALFRAPAGKEGDALTAATRGTNAHLN
jgi:hypothetical protein